MKRIVLSLMALGAVVFGAPQAKADKLQDILAKGVVRIGVPLDAPPFGSQDANRNPIGFDIELAEMVKASIIPLEQAWRGKFFDNRIILMTGDNKKHTFNYDTI